MVINGVIFTIPKSSQFLRPLTTPNGKVYGMNSGLPTLKPMEIPFSINGHFRYQSTGAIFFRSPEIGLLVIERFAIEHGPRNS